MSFCELVVYVFLVMSSTNFRETYKLNMTSSEVITVENLESCSKDAAEYSIKISDFLRKARALYTGKGKILSRPILIQNSTFQVEMLLNGKDHLSPVFLSNLMNLSGSKVLS